MERLSVFGRNQFPLIQSKCLRKPLPPPVSIIRLHEKFMPLVSRVLLKKDSSPSHYFNQLIPLTDPLLTSFLEVSHSLSLPHFYGANFAVRKRFFERAGRFRSRDGRFYRVSEDVQLGLKLRKVGEVRFLKDLVVYTSARKLDSGSWKVPLTNAKNYISMAVLGKEI